MNSESFLINPTTESAERDSFFSERSPALSVLIAFILGILTDSFFSLSLIDWITLSVLAVLVWLILFYKGRNSLAALLLLCFIGCMGGLRHHAFWFCQEPDHIIRVLESSDQYEDSSELVRVAGIVNSTPQIKYPDDKDLFRSDRPQKRTSLVLSCRELINGAERRPVSGKILVAVYDPVDAESPVSIGSGDVVEICGKLKYISGKRNPRDYDFALHFRKEQIKARLTANFSEAIIVRSKPAPYVWQSIRSNVQHRIKTNILSHTSADTQSVALALLLGERTELSPDIRNEFSRSGLIHFLAISGLHIGFFSLFIWSLCHVFNLSRTLTVGVLICAIGFYLSIIEVRPPILRAASFCILVVLGLVNWRTITTLNLVCLSALVILIINPTDLFDPGTQLSFLAVSAILWTVRQDFYQNLFSQSWVPLRWRILAADPVLQTPLQWILIRYFRLLYSVFLVTFFIWIMTAPLVMYYFNLLAPIGLLVNTLIFPFLFLVLLLGYLLIFIGPFVPYGTSLFGFCFDSSLRILLQVVEFTSQIPGGHFELPSPSLWWLTGYYVAILLAVLPVRMKTALIATSIQKLRLSLAPAWVIGGLIFPLMIPAAPALKCTFIAVDHGAAILIQAPNGQTVLYDAGSMPPVRQTYDKIRKTLLHQGIRRVDLLLLSHADRDHYNAVSELIQNGYLRAIAFPKAFLNHEQQGVSQLCDLAFDYEIPIRLIGKGDQIAASRNLSLKVVHPRFADEFEDDNPASLTILVQFCGRKILLTGDLEGKGLSQALSGHSPGPIDVLLSPHHGSSDANTTELANWAKPDFLIVSGGKQQTIPNLEKVFPDKTRIYSTMRHGSLACRITIAGELTVTPFRAEPGVWHQE